MSTLIATPKSTVVASDAEGPPAYEEMGDGTGKILSGGALLYFEQAKQSWIEEGDLNRACHSQLRRSKILSRPTEPTLKMSVPRRFRLRLSRIALPNLRNT